MKGLSRRRTFTGGADESRGVKAAVAADSDGEEEENGAEGVVSGKWSL